jgi:translation initiation factor 2 beta subunit (eIF-2beta)/eIF-5
MSEKDRSGENAYACGTSLAESEHCKETADNGSMLNATNARQCKTIDELRGAIADDIVCNNPNGKISMFTSPFVAPLGCEAIDNGADKKHSRVPLVYCDQTASNRPVKSIEEYIQRVCLPLYGNTHTNTSITGSQSTAFVAEARQIVAEECNAKITGKASQDVVLFA